MAQNSHHSILSLDKNIRNDKTKFYFIHFAFINILINISASFSLFDVVNIN